MKNLIVLLAIVTAFGIGSVYAGEQNYGDLAGKKWTGTRIITRPARAVIKATLEIKTAANERVEGTYTMETDDKPQVVTFESTVEKSPNGLPSFKFKNATGSVEYACELQKDGRLITMRIEGSRSSPHVLDPVK